MIGWYWTKISSRSRRSAQRAPELELVERVELGSRLERPRTGSSRCASPRTWRGRRRVGVDRMRRRGSAVGDADAGADVELACPAIVNGSSSTSSSCWATTSASCSSSTSSIRTANSSPPNRAAVSPARRQPRNRSATATSSSSPAVCPRPSLTVLNSSRSMNSTATRSRASVRRGRARGRRDQ